MDINKDGHVGGSGSTGQVGGEHKAPGGGGM
jgi:hypothetical protein